MKKIPVREFASKSIMPSMTAIDNYTFNDHRHNYAVWTAARAVSRNFTSTANVKLAIEACGLRHFA
jgi:hypothetical protein